VNARAVQRAALRAHCRDRRRRAKISVLMSVPTPASQPPAPSIDVRVERLSKRYGAFWALRDASFDVRAGEILGLIGPNGSGKTTLFRCVAGVAPATSGAVLHAAEAIAPNHRKHFLYFVPDGIRPWPDQTV